MDKEPLVEKRIRQGEQLVRLLEQDGTTVYAAAWTRFIEEDRWKLILVTDTFEGNPLEAYKQLGDLLRQLKNVDITVSEIQLLGKSHRIAMELIDIRAKKYSAVSKSSPITTLGGNPIEGFYVYPPISKNTVSKHTMMHFVLETKDFTPLKRPSPLLLGEVLNKLPWKGKEARTCKVSKCSTRSHIAGDPRPVICDIKVEHRPKGCITYVGQTKYDGWTALMLDKDDDTLLDGHGNPLPPGHPPVYREAEVYRDIDFNEFDFGTLVGEEVIIGIKRVSGDMVDEQLLKSNRVRISNETSFVAPHRHRKDITIILTNRTAGERVDGFGKVIWAINPEDPHINTTISNTIVKIVDGFLEGKYSISNTETDQFIILNLDGLLVDCRPNEEGKKSIFNCISEYVTPGFLEELVVRMEAKYLVDVSLIDGPEMRLLINKHDAF